MYFDVNRIESMKDVIKRFMKSSGVGWMINNQEIILLWNSIVGENIAKQTKVRNIRNGVLHIDIESSSLRHELEQFQSKQIIELLKNIRPDLTLVSIKYHLTKI